MPHYLASNHAIDHLRKRFPAIAAQVGRDVKARAWLKQQVASARVVAQQWGVDLMLGVQIGMESLYFPVKPIGRGDTWIIKTVLNRDMVTHNLLIQRDKNRNAWRRRKGYQDSY